MSAEEVKEKVGVPSVFAFNALVQWWFTACQDQEKVKMAQEASKAWTWKQVLMDIPHCRQSN
eukprot:5258720-Karenia_brevis.AAC.1